MQLAPKLIRREVNASAERQLLAVGLDPVMARIVASRPLPEHPSGVTGSIGPKLQYLDSPFLLKDMDKAVQRLARALVAQECIGIETDHDCDGQTSHAVLYTCLRQVFKHPADKLKSYIGHRLKEGYGLSDALANRILAEPFRPSLIITADNGSSDEARIARLKAEGIDVIVTDHHEMPHEGPPSSAYACINPTQEGCQFPDPYIAGCMVAWLLMAALRRHLLDQGRLPLDAMPITEVLDFVAVGTVADCVSMARSINNRVVVHYGLQKIRAAQRACWQAILPLLKREACAEDLGFVVGPLLNSDGRLSDALGSVSFLLAEDLSAAKPWVETLWQQNQTRKSIQQGLTQAAMAAAQDEVGKGRVSLVIYLPEGHSGVHGISASRIKDAFGRPTILFSPKLEEPEIITGSARSIDGVNVRQALQWVAERYPDIIHKFGGHKGAAGVTIYKSRFETFSRAFEEAVRFQVSPDEVGPVLYTDGVLPISHFTLEFAQQLSALDPYGREFEAPLFETYAEIVSIRMVGQLQTHAQLNLKLDNQQPLSAIWFNCVQAEEVLPFEVGARVHVAFTLNIETFRAQQVLKLQLCYVAKS